MIFSYSTSQQDTEARADLVLEGTIAFWHRDIIPGIKSSIRVIGEHFLFEETPLVIKASPRGRSIHSIVPAAGFWAYSSQVNCKIGDTIKVSLLWHQNTQGLLTLMPYPSSYSVIDLTTGESILYQKRSLASSPMPLASSPILDMPLRWAFMEYSNVNDPVGGRLSPFGPGQNDATTAYDVWTQAWKNTPPKVTFQALYEFEDPPAPDKTPAHFVVASADLGPYQPNHPITWAVTNNVDPNGASFPPPTSVLFNNNNVPWSGFQVPGPTATQVDWVSVAAHEMGHCLGLGHLNGNPNNVMADSIGLGQVKRTLQNDDKDFITNIYG